jgi:DNA-binding NtrC family response regulator
LYYRLNVISLRVPPLRERRDDIFELAIHFLNEYARRVGKNVTRIDEAAIEALVAYDWPGNIRELENALERAVVLADEDAIRLSDLPTEILRPTKRRARRGPAAVAVAAAGIHSEFDDGPDVHAPAATNWQAFSAEDLDGEWNAYERQRLLDVLGEAAGNKSEAARLLGMPRSTLVSKLKKHGIA